MLVVQQLRESKPSTTEHKHNWRPSAVLVVFSGASGYCLAIGRTLRLRYRMLDRVCGATATCNALIFDGSTDDISTLFDKNDDDESVYGHLGCDSGGLSLSLLQNSSFIRTGVDS